MAYSSFLSHRSILLSRHTLTPHYHLGAGFIVSLPSFSVILFFLPSTVHYFAITYISWLFFISFLPYNKAGWVESLAFSFSLD